MMCENKPFYMERPLLLFLPASNYVFHQMTPVIEHSTRIVIERSIILFFHVTQTSLGDKQKWICYWIFIAFFNYSKLL